MQGAGRRVEGRIPGVTVEAKHLSALRLDLCATNGPHTAHEPVEPGAAEPVDELMRARDVDAQRGEPWFPLHGHGAARLTDLRRIGRKNTTRRAGIGQGVPG